MSTAKRSWINTISIKYNVSYAISRELIPENAKTLARLTRLCNNIPSMRVKYHPPLWGWSASQATGNPYQCCNLIFSAQMINCLLRGKIFDHVVFGVGHSIEFMRHAEYWRHGSRDEEGQVENAVVPVQLSDLQANNLKYFPSIPEGTQVLVFTEPRAIVQGREAVNKYLGDWMEHGI